MNKIKHSKAAQGEHEHALSGSVDCDLYECGYIQ